MLVVTFSHSNRKVTTTVGLLRKTGAVSSWVDLVKELGSSISHLHKTSTESVAPGSHFMNLRMYFHELWGNGSVRKEFIGF